MTEYRSIAALGSSYAAGPNIKPIVNRAAMRSGNNYAHVLARSIGADLTDLTVSGATTPTILDTPQRVGLVKFAPQLASLPADTDLVLVTAAGNDLGYLGSAIKLAAYFILDKYTGGQLRRWKPPRLPVTTSRQRDGAVLGLTKIVVESRRRAPTARVVLVDYLPMVSESTTPGEDVPFDSAAIDALAAVHQQLTGVFDAAANNAGAEVLHASRLGIGHELGSVEPWVQPMQPLHRFPASFHPNAAGMQAIAAELRRTITAT
ncbi:SGNH/GDSL hydrolase family protein [Mycobacterium sp. 852002-51057_SCH5723018]|uniref:SGNH/GDSL hydrolase family protein n=1 Tax=Mycobacterium sp. 852002-51057_SCH5723018 TaxID=1834094 RepID=UPI0007FE4DE2|nr:SGNH/GDSL hydrolase family protein [Mycobacterium sp. 852002-51057_SCH5723018]OBG19710.1 hypothetical protein A5764_16150 [Mycobacterium sp. 852002-51057_SCH5723018]